MKKRSRQAESAFFSYGLKKGGVSTVVAVVLLVLMVVAAVAILWNAVLPDIEEGAEEASSEKVQLEIGLADGYTYWDSNKSILSVQVKRGADTADLTGIQFIFWDGTNTITVDRWDIPLPNSIKVYEFKLGDYTPPMGKPILIRIAPYISDVLQNSVFEVEDIKDKAIVDPFGCTQYLYPCQIERCKNTPQCPCRSFEENTRIGWLDICSRDDLEDITNNHVPGNPAEDWLGKKYIVADDIDASDEKFLPSYIVSAADLTGSISSTQGADGLKGVEAVKSANSLLVDILFPSSNMELGLVAMRDGSYSTSMSHELTNNSGNLYSKIRDTWFKGSNLDIEISLDYATTMLLNKPDAEVKGVILFVGKNPKTNEKKDIKDKFCSYDEDHNITISTIGFITNGKDGDLEDFLEELADCAGGYSYFQYADSEDQETLEELYERALRDLLKFANPFTPIGYVQESISDSSLKRVGAFSGQFDGNGKKIYNLVIDYRENSNIGFFGELEDASIEDVRLEITTSIGNNNVGALAGYAKNTTINKAYVSQESSVNGRDNVGSLLGHAEKVELTQAFSDANVNGGENTGGLIGYAQEVQIKDSFYNSPNFRGKISAGGLVGEGIDVEIINSYSAGILRVKNNSAGIIGVVSGNSVIQNVFSVMEIISTSSEINLGGIVGRADDVASIEDSYWFNHASDNATVCVGSDVTFSDCNEKNESTPQGIDYFEIYPFEPYATWNSNIWDPASVTEGKYPLLDWTKS